MTNISGSNDDNNLEFKFQQKITILLYSADGKIKYFNCQIDNLKVFGK